MFLVVCVRVVVGALVRDVVVLAFLRVLSCVWCALRVCECVSCVCRVVCECVCVFKICLLLGETCSCVCGFVGRLVREVVGVGVCLWLWLYLCAFGTLHVSHLCVSSLPFILFFVFFCFVFS